MISPTNLLSAIARAEWCAMRGKRKRKTLYQYHKEVIMDAVKSGTERVNRFNIDFSVFFSAAALFKSLSISIAFTQTARRLFCVIVEAEKLIKGKTTRQRFLSNLMKKIAGRAEHEVRNEELNRIVL